MAADDLLAAVDLLGDKPYFFGDRPTTTDCTLYGFLATTLWAPIPYAGQKELMRHASLVSFCERMHERFWPELCDPSRASLANRGAPATASSLSA
jgi:glutathione S-transferase